MTRPAPDAPIETRWEGRYITVQQQGTWEYVSRARGIHAAVILAIEEAADGRHVILVEQYRVPLKRSEERRVGKGCVSTGRSRWSPDTSTKKRSPSSNVTK